jgi:galactose mutarotase-like enzyme
MEKTMTTLSNRFLTLEINNRGAELCSLCSSDGTETIWQADPTVWNRHAPVLFPLVGKLRDNRYALNGKVYELPQHGFARDMDFALIEQSATALTYQLLPTEETRACYPFEFSLNITYRLTGSDLSIEYAVRNNGPTAMPFSIGAHPGFTLPGPIDECFLEFEKTETLCARLLGPDGLISDKTAPVLENTKILPLGETLFDRDALIFMDAKTKKITLGSKNSSRRLTVEFAGFPQLGIWSKPGAPFVCIEPWFGCADTGEPYGEISNKPGIILLEAGEAFCCTHRIIIES